jgi:hypothetical protein
MYKKIIMKLKNKKVQIDKRVDCFLQKDFDFILNFYLGEIEKLKKTSTTKNLQKLIQVSKHAFYLQSFIEDAGFFGYPQITKNMRNRFLKDYGSKQILKKIQQASLKKALSELSGQCHIGENEYTIYKNNIYYRTLAGEWFKIHPSEIFYLLPKLDNKIDKKYSEYLEATYQPSNLDLIYASWYQKNWSAKVDPSLIQIKKTNSTPEKYLAISTKQIKNILDNPASLVALKNISGKDYNYLEQLIKVSYKIINFINTKRNDSVHLLHLLRDGIMFAEAQKTIDFLLHKNSSSSQIMISRKVLSSPDKEEFYWTLIVDVLYASLRKHPHDFNKFYAEYIIQMQKQEKEYPKLQVFFSKLANYINSSMDIDTRKIKSIVICDTGLQGSINMLVKYLLDNYIFKNKKVKIQTDIYLFVVGEWFKGIYKNKYFDDYYPMMKDIEIFMRSDQLYHYKKNSFEQGKLEVEMGGEKQQLLANVELFVLVQMCMLMRENKLI